MPRFIRYIAIGLSVFIIFAQTLPVSAETATGTVSLLISEVQTGGLNASGQEDPKGEFIEIYNPGQYAVSLDGVRLEYLSSGHTGAGEPTRMLATLTGTLAASHFYLVSFPGYLESDAVFLSPASNTVGLLARSGGHIRLANSQGDILDLLSWGSATAIGQYWKSPVIPPGMSVQRILPGESEYNQGREFRAPTLEVSPASGLYTSSPAEQTPLCQDITLSEILPNAAGTDIGKEFIEVHNPTEDSVTLKGCTIQIGEGEIFTTPDELLPAGAYRVFYDTETGLTLPNTTAQAVSLRTAAGTQRVLYPDGLSENHSWIFMNDTWVSTVTPTPGRANILQADKDNKDAALTSVVPTDCGPGKERNPDTNRCRAVLSVAMAATCKSGYERNPATNRCRSLGAVNASTTTPCKTGQQRNPETNRCRAVASAASAAKPCPSGQERNAETNRCRKVTATVPNSMAAVHDVFSDPLTSNYRWWIAGFVVLAAAGYAIYEWRNDIYNGFTAVVRRHKPK